jgi:predicted dehydrogenase
MGSAQFYKPHDYFLDGPWRTKTASGGGPILINLIHEIGNLRMLVGEIEAVQAIGSSKQRGFEVEDSVAINLLFESGALGVFLLSDTAAAANSWELTSGENPAYPNYPNDDCYLIAGTQGSLTVPSMRLRYFPEGIEASWLKPFQEETLQLHRADPLVRQLEHYIGVIRDEVPPLVSALDGYKNLLVTEAIKESCKSGMLVATGYHI